MSAIEEDLNGWWWSAVILAFLLVVTCAADWLTAYYASTSTSDTLEPAP